MLNLLVAIVSKSFEDINDNWESAMYQERASIISENAYLQGGVEMVQNKIIELEGQLKDFQKEFQESHEEFSNNVNQKLEEIQNHLGIKKAAWANSPSSYPLI